MQKRSKAEARRSLLLCLFILGFVTALIVIPYGFTTAASQKGLIIRTSSDDPGLPNYDIRNERKNEAIQDYLASVRSSIGSSAFAVADIRDGFVRGEQALRSRLPDVKFEYNEDIRIPEVITPDVWKSNIQFLSSPSSQKHSEVLRNFVKENNELVGVNDAQADSLRVIADYTNPDGNLSFAHLQQDINGIPVFRGEVKAGFTKDGRIIRVINNLAPGLDYASLSSSFGDPMAALKAAAGYINNKELMNAEVTANAALSSDLKVVFGEGDFADVAEKMYFPTEPGIAVPAWRVLIWQPRNAYYVIVDANNGTLLWRKNLTEDQTQPATFNVYRNLTGYIDVADSPFPLSPGPIDPTLGTQGSAIARTPMVLIGNEVPNAFNNLGWLTDGSNTTDGNNVQAGLDRKLPNAQSPVNPSDIDPDGMATGSPSRVFNFAFTPGNPNTNMGDTPIPGGSPGTCLAQADATLPSDYQKAAVTQLFYVVNRYHDKMYQLGFTEPAFNFQNDNFGRGGAAGDRVSAQAQDCSGTDNANFTTPADGTRGSMQMYIWTGPTPDFDGDLDAEVIIHEHTHGVSNRLHGNSSGLSTNMSRGMGEGWGDFFGYSMLADPADNLPDPTDPVNYNKIYTTGGYATYLIGAGFTANYYYGIRRFPRAPITFLGANGKPYNPFTFQYVNSNCNTLIGTTSSGPNSAFPRGPVGSSTCDQVHNLGEIWSSALWEVRNRTVLRLGFTAGTTKALQLVTDGMKLAPLGPTFLSERDAILAAAAASSAADTLDVREGFRVRGMGFSAAIVNAGTGGNNTSVTEAFDVPNVLFAPPFTVSDSTGDNDGFPEPGENVLISVPVTNTSGATINSVSVSITGGGTDNTYGNIANGATVTRQITYTVPGGAACGSQHQVNITGSSAVGAMNPTTFTFQLGAPVGGAPVTFTNSTAVRDPATGTGPGVADVYPTTINVAGLSGNKKIKLEFTNLNTTFPGDMDWLLVGPGGQKFIVMSDVVSSFTTQTNANVVLSDDALASLPSSGTINMSGSWKPTDITSGDTFGAPAPAGPYSSPGPVGSATFASVFGTAATGLNGTWSLYGVDDVSGDFATISGWKLTFEANDFACSLTPTVRSRADFDGDGKTDVSIFRPSDGNWWLNQSNAGIAVVHWGVSSDMLTPGDFDGDGKTDFAIFRPNADSSQPDFFILNSNGLTLTGVSWGLAGDIPLIADYDGDGKSDIAVYRPTDHTFYILNSGGGATFTPYGVGGDIPVPGDFIGDNKADITVFRPSTNQWWIFNGSGDTVVQFGAAGDVLVPADYNGDNKDDVAVFRPSTGQWIYQPSGGGAAVFVNWGTSGDIPVPGDYDADGKDDFAVYRNGTWWLNRSTSGVAVSNFGLATDKPIPRAYFP